MRYRGAHLACGPDQTAACAASPTTATERPRVRAELHAATPSDGVEDYTTRRAEQAGYPNIGESPAHTSMRTQRVTAAIGLWSECSLAPLDPGVPPVLCACLS